MLYAALLFSVSGTVQADVFTSKDFLALAEAHQKFWIEGAVDMAGLVAAHSGHKEQEKSVIQWYYGDKHAERNSLILASMEKYSDVPPDAVVLALIERACDKFKN